MLDATLKRAPGFTFERESASTGSVIAVEDARDGFDSPGFTADQMLARVARHLRLLGYDCELVPGGKSDEALVRAARSRGRILLTCARSLGITHPSDVVILPADDPPAAIRQVVRRWPLAFDRTMFSRCSICNVPVEDCDPADISGRIPERVLQERCSLTICPRCKRIYWRGGHVERIREAFARAYGIHL